VVPALSGTPSGVFQRVRYGTCPLATANLSQTDRVRDRGSAR
jgi:hypothetical protein